MGPVKGMEKWIFTGVAGSFLNYLSIFDLNIKYLYMTTIDILYQKGYFTHERTYRDSPSSNLCNTVCMYVCVSRRLTPTYPTGR